MLQQVKCPNCSGNINSTNTSLQIKCNHCGTSFILKNKLTTETIDSLLNLAVSAEDAENHEEAYNYFTKALTIEPNNGNAWFGKARSAVFLSSLANIRIMEGVEYFEKAINTKNFHLTDLINTFTKINTFVPLIINKAEGVFVKYTDYSDRVSLINSKNEMSKQINLILLPILKMTAMIKFVDEKYRADLYVSSFKSINSCFYEISNRVPDMELGNIAVLVNSLYDQAKSIKSKIDFNPVESFYKDKELGAEIQAKSDKKENITCGVIIAIVVIILAIIIAGIIWVIKQPSGSKAPWL